MRNMMNMNKSLFLKRIALRALNNFELWQTGFWVRVLLKCHQPTFANRLRTCWITYIHFRECISKWSFCHEPPCSWSHFFEILVEQKYFVESLIKFLTKGTSQTLLLSFQYAFMQKYWKMLNFNRLDPLIASSSQS